MKHLAAVSVCAALFSLNLAARPAGIRVGSYNLRMENLDKGENVWSLRRGRLMKSIRENRFDVFGLQELTENVQADLRETLGDRYEFVFFSPYSQDGIGGKAQGIGFDRKRFSLVEKHFFWPSDTPDTMCENDHRSGGKRSFKRGGMCLILKDLKYAGKTIFIMNAHAALNREDHLKHAHVFVDMEKRFNPDSLPSFFVGDLNARPSHPSTPIFLEHWKDAAVVHGKGSEATFNGFCTNPEKWAEDDRRIDYIYYRNIGDPVNYLCNHKLYNGHCASDHFPIRADFIY